MTFQRARSEEQREVRRQAILEAATAMLGEMPVSELSLNELSRRVGLAKSNVLRYFESREAVLLELLDHAFRQWVAEVTDELSTSINPKRPALERGDRLAAVLGQSLARQRVLCDLMSAQPSVLEHNVSVDVVVHIKRSGCETLGALAEAVRRHLPELGAEAWGLCLTAVVIAGAFSTHARLSDSALAAFEADPELAVFRIDLPTALEATLATLITGTLARSAGRQKSGKRTTT